MCNLALFNVVLCLNKNDAKQKKPHIHQNYKMCAKKVAHTPLGVKHFTGEPRLSN